MLERTGIFLEDHYDETYKGSRVKDNVEKH